MSPLLGHTVSLLSGRTGVRSEVAVVEKRDSREVRVAAIALRRRRQARAQATARLVTAIRRAA
ncbi:hypothetical protein B4N89_19085 [Embleya scabrispora]|uniref:Uncharacterized protein n=1 Tax=Embleya scabrispora TaxID=159449 RepID=A0A1T3P0Y5_9ACTN|nr:hypothetical protein B4N89_19085 [Embleya scabrispora]